VGTNIEQISICISVLELVSSFEAYYVDAALLNLSDGGTNVKNMRDGWYMNDTGERVIHKMLTEVVKGRGHKIIFFPKFHCKLNFIEMVWGWMKFYHRRNYTYNYLHLKNNLPNIMLVEIPIIFVGNAARHCYRFMNGYRQDLNGPLLDYTMKTCSV
jgi:hypothetical protein